MRRFFVVYLCPELPRLLVHVLALFPSAEIATPATGRLTQSSGGRSFVACVLFCYSLSLCVCVGCDGLRLPEDAVPGDPVFGKPLQLAPAAEDGAVSTGVRDTGLLSMMCCPLTRYSRKMGSTYLCSLESARSDLPTRM